MKADCQMLGLFHWVYSQPYRHPSVKMQMYGLSIYLSFPACIGIYFTQSRKEKQRRKEMFIRLWRECVPGQLRLHDVLLLRPGTYSCLEAKAQYPAIFSATSKGLNHLVEPMHANSHE